MNKELELAVRKFLRAGGATKLFGHAFTLLVVIVAGQLSSQMASYFPQIGVLSPVLRDPFTVLAAAIFLFSRTIFDFMKFRLQSTGEISQPIGRLVEQLELPKRYRRKFGDDFCTKAWRWRLAFVVSFGIAVVRWILNLD